ncbi:T9SS type A sorting domain-containing protein [Hymenobacter sp. DG25A]|uniref:T9SS type A sorting domain-containing protein n=1 Tax=Hymenobacter sp. DG25A TaxID=1385663 RepID=UPI0018D08334|nr:T9SS type A sorting domain-containing protein [Hymenobacter sp. DG25A]
MAGKPEVYTLRLDSAFMIGADSVYRFNRIMRPDRFSPELYHKSDNNLFGAQLRFVPGSQEVVLEALADALQTPVQLLLRPAAAVGSTWQASAGVTAVLSSRTQRSVHGVEDMVATVLLSTGQQVLIGEKLGFLQAPQWLTLDAATAVNLQAARGPVTWAESEYYPARLFNFQPGDEVGYETYDRLAQLVCTRTLTLRRIRTRAQTADSLIYTFTEQAQTRGFQPGNPCSGSYAETLQPTHTGRLALPLRAPVGRSPIYLPGYGPIGLLTGGYAFSSENTPASYTLELPATTTTSTGCASAAVRHVWLYPNTRTQGTYYTGLDYLVRQQNYGNGQGDVFDYDTELVYSRRKQPDGSYQTCGSRLSFYVLLPARTARAATFISYPNPATDQITLHLPAAATVGTNVYLLDGLGRIVDIQPVAAGNATVLVPLKILPAGVYTVEVHMPQAAVYRARVQHIQ